MHSTAALRYHTPCTQRQHWFALRLCMLYVTSSLDFLRDFAMFSSRFRFGSFAISICCLRNFALFSSRFRFVSRLAFFLKVLPHCFLRNFALSHSRFGFVSQFCGFAFYRGFSWFRGVGSLYYFRFCFVFALFLWLEVWLTAWIYSQLHRKYREYCFREIYQQRLRRQNFDCRKAFDFHKD